MSTLSILLVVCVAPGQCFKKPASVSLDQIRSLRQQAAQRKRTLIVHSDGYPMNDRHRGIFEPSAPPSLFPQLTGSQTAACTYSLVHQFPVARLYRAKVAQEWPPGVIKKMYGNSADGLDRYIQLCRRNRFDAFWAMRMNDTHDASDGPHGMKRWKSNLWKQKRTHLLFAKRGTPLRYGRWSSLDYRHKEVRDKVYAVLEEVCRNYPIDGLLLDFFRHLPTFRSTAIGGRATEKEAASLTKLFERIRAMADREGAKRGRPILIAVRTPDSASYSKALGIDVETWMQKKLIDIWLSTGYFRLREWSDSVMLGHKYNVKVWASISDSRIVARKDRNSLAIYRGRISNAWRGGVDGVWLFNFFYRSNQPQFQLLKEAGDAKTLLRKDKTFVSEGRGRLGANRYLKAGNKFFTRPTTVAPNNPITLSKKLPSFVLPIQVADGPQPRQSLTLRVQVKGKDAAATEVRLNGKALMLVKRSGEWLVFQPKSKDIVAGENKVGLSLASKQTKIEIRDLQLDVSYR